MGGGWSIGLNPDDGRRKFYSSRSTGLNPMMVEGRRMVYWAKS
jgi:hypothetical protein